eukprot:12048783-Alexandrium_andersonii.AAC.1
MEPRVPGAGRGAAMGGGTRKATAARDATASGLMPVRPALPRAAASPRSRQGPPRGGCVSLHAWRGRAASGCSVPDGLLATAAAASPAGRLGPRHGGGVGLRARAGQSGTGCACRSTGGRPRESRRRSTARVGGPAAEQSVPGLGPRGPTTTSGGRGRPKGGPAEPAQGRALLS